ncbi:MAG TPA: hypothetical protein VMF58_09965, partial [Rhizomicrobium sp.]|nr:hypothetical protein [Rhizomicrobium sp.]
MKPFSVLPLAFFAASLAFTTAIADPAISSAQAAMESAKAHPGFSTKAKVALLYGISQIVRSKNVSSLTSPTTGVYCVTPSVKLDFKNLYPHITVERALSVGTAFWAYWVDDSS